MIPNSPHYQCIYVFRFLLVFVLLLQLTPLTQLYAFAAPVGSALQQETPSVLPAANFISSATLSLPSLLSVYAEDQLPQCGPERWSVTHDGAAHLEDQIAELVVDNANNVIITGSSAGEGNNQSVWSTLKYDDAGNLLWQYTYYGVGDQNGTYFDQGRGLAVDTIGNVYLTGVSLTTTHRDIVTIKLSPTGEEQWVQSYNGQAPDPNNQDDFVNGIVIANEHVHVFGRSANQSHFIVLVYTLDGQFVRELSIPAQATKAFAVDETGNLFLAGLTWDAAYNKIIHLARFDAAGNLQWSRTTHSDVYLDNEPLAMRLDAMGNLYLLADSHRQTPDGYSEPIRLLFRYTADGSLLWERAYLYNGAAIADTLVVDEQGNAYTIGWPDGSTIEQNILAVKYGPDGALSSTFTVAGSERVTPLTLAVDRDNHVTIVGGSHIRTGNTGTTTLTTNYFTSDGIPLWVARHPANYVERSPSVFAVDGAHLYVGGSSAQGDMLVLAYAITAFPTTNYLMANDMAIADGDIGEAGSNPPNVYVTISLTAPAAETVRFEYHTVAATATANVDYISQTNIAFIEPGQNSIQLPIPIYGNQTTETTPKVFFLQIGCVTGAIVLDGQAQITIFDDDTDLRLWSRRIGDGNTVTLEPLQAKVDAADNLYIAAAYHDSTFTGDVVLKYTAEGVLLWQQLLPGGYVPDMLIDGPALYVTAQLLDEDSDVITHKLSLDGALLWTHRYNSSVLSHDEPRRLISNGQDGVIIAGSATKLTLDDGKLTSLDSDALLVAVDASGNTHWAYTYDSPEHRSDEAGGVGRDSLGNSYMVGLSSFYPAPARLFWLQISPAGVQQELRTYELENTAPTNIRNVSGNWQGVMTVAGDGTPFGYLLRILPDGAIAWQQYLYGSPQVFSFLTNDRNEGFLTTSQQMIKYGTQGKIVWQRELTGAFTFPHQTVVLASNGLIYGAASQSDLIGGQEQSIAGVLDQQGYRLWKQVVHESGSAGNSRLTAIAPLANQGVYVTGAVRKPTDLGYSLLLERFQAPPLLPLLTIHNMTVQEPEEGMTNVLVPLTLSTAARQDVQVVYATISANATSRSDFTSQSGTLVIPAGQSFAQISIPILQDKIVESGEQFFVQLGKVSNAVVNRSTATVTIIDANARLLFLPLAAQ